MSFITKEEMRARQIALIREKLATYFDLTNMDDGNLIAANSTLASTTGTKVVFIVKHMSPLSELKKVIDEAMSIFTTLVNPIIRFIRQSDEKSLLQIVKYEAASNWVFLLLDPEQTGLMVTLADKHHMDFYCRDGEHGFVYYEHVCSGEEEVTHPPPVHLSAEETFITDVGMLATEVRSNAKKKYSTIEFIGPIFKSRINALNDAYRQMSPIVFTSNWGDYVIINALTKSDGNLFIGMIEPCDYNINGKITRVYMVIHDKDFEEVLFKPDGGAELFGNTIKAIGKWV